MSEETPKDLFSVRVTTRTAIHCFLVRTESSSVCLAKALEKYFDEEVLSLSAIQLTARQNKPPRLKERYASLPADVKSKHSLQPADGNSSNH